MNKEEQLLQHRLIELSKLSYQKGIVTFSEFLNLNELNILHTTPKQEWYTRYETFGGYEFSERQMVSFLPDALCYNTDYPITALKVSPLQRKFAETLTHRDYLGSILNLGVERCKIGDILVQEEGAVVFLHRTLERYFIEELTRIKHTPVQATLMEKERFVVRPSLKEISGSVSSLRLDSLLSLAFASSRSKLVAYIEGAKVFVNGKLITSNGYQIKEGDIVSVRGLGRFQYVETLSQTKKGRYFVKLNLYI